MALTALDIERMARLARLDLPQDQAQTLLTQLNEFFAVVERISAVDTSGIEPLAHPTHAAAAALLAPIQLRLRADQVSESNQREANQRSAPAVERGLFLVPKVIE
jgi:aspartyl-tRNA(Asn)/glutamyl-tRNA(Gln) amidotransferase subunit C